MRDKPLFVTSLIFLCLFVLFIITIFTPLRAFFAPFVTAGAVVYLFYPLVKFFEKLKIKPMIATILVYAVIIAAIALIIWVAVPKITTAIGEIAHILLAYFKNPTIQKYATELFSGGGKVYKTVVGAAKNTFNVFVGCVAAFYMLSDADNIKKAFKELVPQKLKGAFKLLLDDIKLCFDSFFKGQVLIAAILFVIDALFLYSVRIPYALGLAFIAAVLDIIPYAGAFLAMGIIVVVTLISKPGMIIVVIAGLLIIQQIENNIITPKISSGTLSLHPSVTVLALYAGSFGGFWGILLAIPLSCVLKKYVRD